MLDKTKSTATPSKPPKKKKKKYAITLKEQLTF
jgi:hypothetical protein